MRRFEALQRAMEVIGDELVVCNIGHPCQELFAIRDRPENFYMLGSMGLAAPIGLGLALSQSRRVVVLDGDAAVTMNLGAFATIADAAPPNLVHVIVDNEANGSTGFQRSFTAGRLKLDSVARAAGIEKVALVREEEAVAPALREALATEGPHVIVVKTERGVAEGIAPLPLDAREILDRFRRSLAS